MVQIVEHHTKYKEIHGVDETIWMTRSDHQKLHRRLRKEGKCNIPVKELTEIAVRASLRTAKTKKRVQSAMGKQNRLQFTDRVDTDIILAETIVATRKHIEYSSFFHGANGKKMVIIDIK